MDLTGAGTAIMVAIAAVLWFLYFLPTWVARREYLDTERTATRLQQTLRIMAETAEVPDQVRVEATARDAARQERVQRAREHHADVLAARTAASVRAATPAMPRTAAAVSWSRSEPAPAVDAARVRRRRAHRLASILMVVATAAIGIQLALVMSTGFAPGAWSVFAGGAAVGVAGVIVRRRLAARSARRTAATARAAAPVVEERPVVAERAEAASGWMPVPVPPPLYLSKPEVQPVVPTVQPGELAARLRAAAFAAEEAVRAAHAEPEVVAFPTPASAPAPTQAPAPSRWAAMGRLDGMGAPADAAAPDLDEVFRRRRNAG